MNDPTTTLAPRASSTPLQGRVALVTGASKGLGRAIAQGLAQAGADVVLVSRTRADLEAVAREIEACGRRPLVAVADTTDTAQIEAATQAALVAFGRIDVLVHAAGGSLRKPTLDVTDAEWDAVIAANLSSAFKVCRAVGRHMVQRQAGSIITIASTAGLRGRAGNAPYSAAKAAVINLSRALAMEWAPLGVRVNVLAPGRFLTPLTETEMSIPEKYEAFVRQVPLGRIGRPEELKEIAVWLASDASAYVTGSTITVDGGQTLA
ncbi:glucose 1-dehydrogenase [Acidovorax sp. SUPP2522]|uniref:SDR family NAD(P)-dependent oxidoreductase n=1 Tax=unclassified Acidovorax TaxID=2684926 RepID=UPI0023492EC2|nr:MULTISPECIES: SDR family NAD(P)-dependent oxidoreductase [unclassified Acidovorax]WCM99636.1 SDR family oxidoreductase [Acidovorax sp. GBBC 1281]GKT19065.1 glucose 1-dehydrogenase [Acidovorax sp. SUPP2522]